MDLEGVNLRKEQARTSLSSNFRKQITISIDISDCFYVTGEIITMHMRQHEGKKEKTQELIAFFIDL